MLFNSPCLQTLFDLMVKGQNAWTFHGVCRHLSVLIINIFFHPLWAGIGYFKPSASKDIYFGTFPIYPYMIQKAQFDNIDIRLESILCSRCGPYISETIHCIMGRLTVFLYRIGIKSPMGRSSRMLKHNNKGIAAWCFRERIAIIPQLIPLQNASGVSGREMEQKEASLEI